jgi:ribosomal protein S27E
LKKIEVGAEAMKAKILLITAVLFASLFLVVVTPVNAELLPDDFTMTMYDPTDDVIRVRTGGAFLFDQHNNIDITKMTSSYIDNLGDLLDQIELSMTVTGTIQNSDYYRYGFGVVTEDGKYVIGYTSGAAVGFEYGSSTTFLVTPTVQGNTLTLRFNVAGIGNPQNKFEFKGGATYSKDAYERYIDFGPDKLILITEPSDGSTVNGQITIKGVILESIENKPSGDVEIKIDNGLWQDVTVNDPYWSFPLDTTTLSEDPPDHTISVRVEGETLGIVEDKITIYVDQSTGDYEPLNEIPQVHKGDWYEYISMGDASIVGIPIEVTNQMTTEIEDIETITVGGTSYETYVMKSHTDGGENLGYTQYNQTNDRWSWRKKDDFSTVQEHTISTVELDPRPETTVDAMTTYSPALETHNFFDVTVGFNIGPTDNRWTFNTNAQTESKTIIGGDETTNPDYSDNLNIIGECLYYLPNINVRGNTFEDIFVIRTHYDNPDYENPGVSVVEYYSKELGMPVRIDTFDTSRNLLFSLGLDDWKQVPYSIDIEDVTFDPSPPKAEKNNKIIIDVKNVGDEAAQNVKITVMDGNIEVAQETITSIAAGSTKDLTVDWKPSDEGNHSIQIIASYQNDDLDDETYYVDVDPPDEDTGFNILFLIIIVIVVVIIILAVVLLKRRGAETPEGEEAEAEAEEPTEAAAPAQAAAPVVVGAEPEVTPKPQAAPQGITESIQCPSCKQNFTVSYESKPVRVKCPSCGTEGVLR